MGQEENMKITELADRLEDMLSKYSYEEVGRIKSEDIVNLYIKKIDLN